MQPIKTAQPPSFFRRFSIGVTVLWLGLFALLPTLALLLVSFLDTTESYASIPLLTLRHYLELFDPVFLTILWDTVWLAILSTCLCLIIGYPFAYLIARTSPGIRQWLLLLVMIPFWTNSLIRTYALILMIGAQGIINKILLFSGIINEPLKMMYTDFAVFIGLSYTLLPFMVLPLYASIEKLDGTLIDAAQDLGASRFRAFWHITIPLTLPGIVGGCMLVFLPALGCFYVPEILGGSKNMLLGTFIKNQFLLTENLPLGSAASTILTVLLIILALFYRFTSRRSMGQKKEDAIHSPDKGSSI